MPSELRFLKDGQASCTAQLFFQLITQLLHKLYTCCTLCYFEILYLNLFSFLYVEKLSILFHGAERPLLQNFNSIHEIHLEIYCIFSIFTDPVGSQCTNNPQIAHSHMLSYTHTACSTLTGPWTKLL